MLEYYFFYSYITLHHSMGQRANLFEEARNTINVLKSKAASRHTYERNFPMSIMRVTRRHLHNVSIELIDAFEKNRYISIPALMKRYYKLNQLHISQLTRYLKMCLHVRCHRRPGVAVLPVGARRDRRAQPVDLSRVCALVRPVWVVAVSGRPPEGPCVESVYPTGQPTRQPAVRVRARDG